MGISKYVVDVKGVVFRTGIPFKVVGSVDENKGFTSKISEEIISEMDINKTFEEFCLNNKQNNTICYFKSSKFLRSHGIIFMVTVYRAIEDKFKFFLAFEKGAGLVVKNFNLNKLPLEVKKEYFVTDVEELSKLHKEIKTRVEFELRDSKRKLEGMSVFK